MLSLPKTYSEAAMVAAIHDVQRRAGSVRILLKDNAFELLPDAGPRGRYKRATYKGSTIYLLGFDRWVKIGFTTSSVQKRAEAIQTGLPFKLEIIATLAGTPDIERQLHRRFAAYRAQGEWFSREGDLAAWIDAGCPNGGGDD